MRASHTLAALLATLVWGACGTPELPAVGDLHGPTGLALHEPSGRLFVASLDTDEVRVLDLSNSRFLIAPATSFPLSIPTAPRPVALAAGARTIFVLSGADGAIAFIDTETPPGGRGPRTIETPDREPLTVPVDLVPMAIAPVAPREGEGGPDRLLVVGFAPDAEGGRLAVVAGPSGESAPELSLAVEIPGASPVALAIDAPADPSVEDCRTVAVADRGHDDGPGPGIWLSTLRRDESGIEIEAFDEERRIEVSVPVTLPDGSVEPRLAPVRSLVFTPVPEGEAETVNAAAAADPCAVRSGRLLVTLNPIYCGDAISCPNFAVIDLDGEGGTLAEDARGGPAAYEFPGAQLAVTAIEGPLSVSGAWDPSRVEDGVVQAAGPVDVVALVSSTDGNLSYVSVGFGSFLVGADGERAEPAPVFPLSSQREGPGLLSPVRRGDIGRQLPATSFPTVAFPEGALPRDESWTAGFEIAVPGFEGIGVREDLEGDAFRASDSVPNFLRPIPLRVSDDPEQSDRLVPFPLEGDPSVCDGYPIREISADGTTLFVDLEADGFDNPQECAEPSAVLSILPPRGAPWLLEGEVTGFVGRVSSELVSSRIFVGSRLLFTFAPPEDEVARGASYEWTTTDGFEPLRFVTGSRGLLPVALAPFRRSPGPPPRWQIWVTFSGSDTLLAFDPSRPDVGGGVLFR